MMGVIIVNLVVLLNAYIVLKDNVYRMILMKNLRILSICIKLLEGLNLASSSFLFYQLNSFTLILNYIAAWYLIITVYNVKKVLVLIKLVDHVKQSAGMEFKQNMKNAMMEMIYKMMDVILVNINVMMHAYIVIKEIVYIVKMDIIFHKIRLKYNNVFWFQIAVFIQDYI